MPTINSVNKIGSSFKQTMIEIIPTLFTILEEFQYKKDLDKEET